jgi:hypothetical protein
VTRCCAFIERVTRMQRTHLRGLSVEHRTTNDSGLVARLAVETRAGRAHVPNPARLLRAGSPPARCRSSRRTRLRTWRVNRITVAVEARARNELDAIPYRIADLGTAAASECYEGIRRDAPLTVQNSGAQRRRLSSGNRPPGAVLTSWGSTEVGAKRPSTRCGSWRLSTALAISSWMVRALS